MIFIVALYLIFIGIDCYYINRRLGIHAHEIIEQGKMFREQKYRIDELENALRNHSAYHSRNLSNKVIQ